jgi:hypothetical protein
MRQCRYVDLSAGVDVRLVMPRPAKRRQYGYQLSYILGHDKSALPKQRARAGKAFLPGQRAEIAEGFIGTGHGLCQPQGA